MIWLPRIRFVLIFVLLGMAVLAQVRYGLTVAWSFYVGSGLLLLLHLFLGDVWVAFRQLQHGKFAQAQKLFDRTWWPDLLIPRNRAYYYLGTGIIALRQKDWAQAETRLLKALALKLPRTNDRAIAQLNLAHLHYVQEQHDQAQEWLAAAQAEQPTDLLVKEELAKLVAYYQ